MLRSFSSPWRTPNSLSSTASSLRQTFPRASTLLDHRPSPLALDQPPLGHPPPLGLPTSLSGSLGLQPKLFPLFS